jgi:LmbE family N-acetylglucosaminyl deacetylase
MLHLDFSRGKSTTFNLLCLGAHSDDIEIGCGGFILRLINEIPNLSIRWIVFSGSGERAIEAHDSAAAFLKDMKASQVEVLNFRDGYFPFQGAEIKDVFEALKRDFDPSVVLTHRMEDAHQDHRILSELTYNTFRNHMILEYEIPKYDGDLGNPNFFAPLAKALLGRKIDLILAHFRTQHGRAWFTKETFEGLARLRGIGCNAPEGFAEAFYARKVVL